MEGVATIHVGSAGGGSGDYRLRTRLRPRGEGPRGGDEDHRDAADPAALDGSYAAFLAALPGEGVRPPALVTGGVDFDGRGRAKTALSKTLAQVRPWSLMVVVASDEAYVDDILTSFR